MIFEIFVDLRLNANLHIKFVINRKGCLADALASKDDEGGERLPKASGSCQLSIDPGISEWGNLSWVNLRYSCLNI